MDVTTNYAKIILHNRNELYILLQYHLLAAKQNLYGVMQKPSLQWYQIEIIILKKCADFEYHPSLTN